MSRLLPAHPERAVAFVLIVAAFALKVPDAAHLRVNTDEPQHLHVVWAWVTGELPYRDVFDNHMPLFHALYSPVLGAVGERPDVVFRMRLAVVPLWALDLFWIARTAGALVSPAAALPAAAVAAVLPPFFLVTTEFRADDLWTTLWLAALATAVGGAMTRPRAFAVGLLLGAAAATSQKTIFLVAALAAAVVVAGARFFGWPGLVARLRRVALPATAGLVAPPLAVVAFFAGRGALDAFVEGVVLHNTLPALGLSLGRALRLGWLPALAFVTHVAARRWLPAESDSRLAFRRLLVFLAGGFYVAALQGLWPLAASQNDLPALGVAAALAPLVPALRDRRAPYALAVAGAVGLVALVVVAPPWRDRAGPERAFLGDVLALTAPGDFVLDPKGEAVFRRRPFFYALEDVTRERMRRGLIPDDIPERVRATRTFVVFPDSAIWPARAREFLLAATVPVGRARVAGRFLVPADDGEAEFAIELAGRYAVVSAAPLETVTLDGSPYRGPRRLERGPHRAAGLGRAPAAVVWATAAERGYSPFAPPR